MDERTRFREALREAAGANDNDDLGLPSKAHVEVHFHAPINITIIEKKEGDRVKGLFSATSSTPLDRQNLVPKASLKARLAALPPAHFPERLQPARKQLPNRKPTARFQNHLSPDPYLSSAPNAGRAR